MFNMKSFLYKTFCGFFLGISFLAPGFSGSMMAIAMGIYHDLLGIVSEPFKRFRENIRFLIPLAIGVVISAVLFILTFNILFQTYEKFVYLLFVGLVAGYLPIIFKQVRAETFRASYLIGGFSSFVIAVFLGVFVFSYMQASGFEVTMDSLALLGISGFVSGVVMFIPGMSVSTILILFGVYTPLIASAEMMMRLDFSPLLPFGLFVVCFLVGLVLVSKLIRRAFEKHPGFSNTAVFGFVFGSLVSIFYQSLQINQAGFSWLIGAVMIVCGFALSMLFVVLGKKVGKQ